MSDATAAIPKVLRQATSSLLRFSRRARGWKVDTEKAFKTQVHIAANMVETHPQVREVWKLGRMARILAVNAIMQELLDRTVGEVVVIDCFTDSIGALGEVHCGYWVCAFRIEMDRRRRSELVLS